MDNGTNNLRQTGIDVLGDLPWGMHCCQFYETKEDLLELLVPYFKAGLENNEYCLWITADPITCEEAFLALKKAIPHFKKYVASKNIEILPYMDWFMSTGKFDAEILNKAWIKKLNEALARGYDGMRINGNETWLKGDVWDNFMEYEEGLNSVLNNRRIIGLCTYPLLHSDGRMLLDVAHAHDRVVTKRKGEWEVLETSLSAYTQSELNKAVRQIKTRSSRLSTILRYGFAVLSVAIALVILLFIKAPPVNDGLYVCLFLCAIIISSWFGGAGPGLLTAVLSLLAFDYYFISPKSLFYINTKEISRLLLLLVPSIFIVWLTATQKNAIGLLRRARIVLEWTVQKLDHANAALQQENEERKKAEAQIRQQVEISNEIIDAIPVMAWSILPSGILDFVNKRWIDYAGISLEELIPEPTRPIYPDDLSGVLENWHRNTKMGEAYDDEMRLRSSDGNYRWFLVRISPLRDKQANIVKWFGVSIDIEARKQAEERLRQSENLLAEAEKIAHIGSWSLDLVSNKVTWSDEVYRMFEIKKSEFDHNLESVFNLIHPDDRSFVKSVVQETIKTHVPYDFYFRSIMPDKRVRIIHALGTVMTNAEGAAVRMYGASQDVTERKQAEDELQLAYQRLSYHVENTPLAVLEWDKDLFITRWSGQAEKIFGWKASEAVGKNIYGSDFRLIYEEDKPQVDKIINELTDDLVNRNFSLNRNYRKDGSVIYCEWYNSVLRDENGNVITMLSLTHDVTERKEAEEKLNESYLRIRSLSEHLQIIREEERAYIAREIHDELGQQLTVMRMDVSWLNKRITEDIGVREKLHDLTKILDATVQSIRKISYELRPHLLDLGLEDAIDWHLKEFAKRSGIKTFLNKPEEELELSDSVKTSLFRIFQESLTNVARHSNASKVQVDLIKGDGYLLLRIKDNGNGFNKLKIIKKNTLGILGMQERATMMGGNYSIESELGNGTVVTVKMPYDNKK